MTFLLIRFEIVRINCVNLNTSAALSSQLKMLREENEISTIATMRAEKQLEELRLRNNQLTQELRERTGLISLFFFDFLLLVPSPAILRVT